MKKHIIALISLLILILVLIAVYVFFGKGITTGFNRYYCEDVIKGKYSCNHGWGVQCNCIKKYKNAGQPCLNSSQCGGSKCLANHDQADYAEKNSSLKLMKGSADLCEKSDIISLPDNLNSKGICQSYPIEDWTWDWELNNGKLNFIHGKCNID